MHKVVKGKIESTKIIDCTYYWIVTDGTSTPNIFEVNKHPHVKVGDLVKIIWRRHYGEETKLVIVEESEHYNPKEGF